MKSIVAIIVAGILGIGMRGHAAAQSAQELLSTVKAKITTVKSYTAAVRIKVDVPFLKAPESTATMYFKAPDKTHIESDGFAMIPKQGADLSAARLLSKPYSAVDLGTAMFQGASLRKVKVVPLDDDPDVVVATLWIDAGLAVVRKVEISMRAGGTVVGELVYDNPKARDYGLPSYAKLMFDVPRFELPKTMTGDFDAPSAAAGDEKKTLKANVELWYSKYEFNVAIPDSKFR